MSLLDFRSVADAEKDKFDAKSRAVTVIEEPHRMVHEGFSFHATGRVAALATASNLDILLRTPAGVFPHLRASLFTMSDSPCDIKAYEAVTASADGVAVTEFNRNRNSAQTPGVVLTTAPTITGLGTLIHDRFVPDEGGTGTHDVGAVSPNLGEEWILKPSTKYLFRLTNNSGGDIIVTWEALWYEINWQNAGV